MFDSEHALALEEDVTEIDTKCWFCNSSKGEMAFDSEFDTYVHTSCIEETLENNPMDPEASLMAYLLED